MHSLYNQNNRVYIPLLTLIIVRVRFTQELTASKILAYKSILLQKRRITALCIQSKPKVIVFVSFIHFKHREEKVYVGNGFASSQSTHLVSVTKKITEPFFNMPHVRPHVFQKGHVSLTQRYKTTFSSPISSGNSNQ